MNGLINEIEQCTSLGDVERLLVRNTSMTRDDAVDFVSKSVTVIKSEDRALASLIRSYC